MKTVERGSETIFVSSSSAESICLKWSMQPVDDVVCCTHIYTKSTLRMIVKEAISTTKLVEKKSLEQFFIHAAILWIIRNFIWSNYALNISSTSSLIPMLAGVGCVMFVQPDQPLQSDFYPFGSSSRRIQSNLCGM